MSMKNYRKLKNKLNDTMKSYIIEYNEDLRNFRLEYTNWYDVSYVISFSRALLEQEFDRLWLMIKDME